MLPVSTYGASKLAGEAGLIGSYAYMFGLSGCAFRFGNVVGARQTHGVGFDFVRRLLYFFYEESSDRTRAFWATDAIAEQELCPCRETS